MISYLIPPGLCAAEALRAEIAKADAQIEQATLRIGRMQRVLVELEKPE